MIKKISILSIAFIIFAGSILPVSALSVSADSAIVIEANSGRVIYEKDADTRRPMASTTKIMTAIVALEACDMSQTVSISGEAVGIEGSSVYLKTGDKLSLGDLVWALMLESANDAAAAIAIEVAGSIEAFAEMMNEKAAELGLTDSHFTNPHGLDNKDHYTTARDLARLASYALKNPRFREIVSTYRHSISFGNETRYLLNHNKMLKLYDGAVGVKTGYTKRSGRCLVSAAERNGVTLVAVTLNAPDDWRDHCEMLDLGFNTMEARELIMPGESVFILPCIGSEKQEITVRNRDGLTVAVPKGMSEVIRRIELPHYFWAPVHEGDKVGRIVFEADGQILGEVSLFADETANRIKYKQGILEKIFG
jgi:D-alanyl-D-alanine carboxypeptidase (penicillin-binding protein 5/6)